MIELQAVTKTVTSGAEPLTIGAMAALDRVLGAGPFRSGVEAWLVVRLAR